MADLDIVAAFATSAQKVGKDLHEAVFTAPNNFPRLLEELPPSGVTVRRGLTHPDEVERIAEELNGARSSTTPCCASCKNAV